jgi:lycopene cyclase domain-containing protein
MNNWTYALLLSASLAIPLIRSFENRVAYYKKWPALFSGILVMMMLFIPWDIVFTRLGVWSFNHHYVTGIYLLYLPLEEWMFFIVITYCCVFIYEVLKYFFPGFHFPGLAFALTLLLGIFTLITALLNMDKIYTFAVMSLSCILLFWQLVNKSHLTWLSHFFFMYFVALLPFFIVNGILTSLPVVSYDNSENLSVRIFSIPVEDAFYFMNMMLITLMVYEHRVSKTSSAVGQDSGGYARESYRDRQ